MQGSLWWWQCSDTEVYRPNLPLPPPPYSLPPPLLPVPCKPYGFLWTLSTMYTYLETRTTRAQWVCSRTKNSAISKWSTNVASWKCFQSKAIPGNTPGWSRSLSVVIWSGTYSVLSTLSNIHPPSSLPHCNRHRTTSSASALNRK